MAKAQQPEMKQHTVQGIAVVPLATWSVLTNAALNIPEGDGAGSRDGEVVRLLGIRLRGHFGSELSELTDIHNSVRVVAYINSTNGVTPLTPAQPFGTNTLVSMRTWDNKGLKIVMDETFNVGSSDGVDNSIGPGGFHFDRYIKLRRKLRYATGATNEPQNAVFTVLFIARAAFTTSVLQMETQAYYRDI